MRIKRQYGAFIRMSRNRTTKDKRIFYRQERQGRQEDINYPYS